MDDLSERLLVLQGIHNFRDYGGYGVAGGGRLRRGMLWRSGQHFEATDADLAAVDTLGLVAVFDLRSDKERASHPCRRPQGFGAAVHFVDEEAPLKQAGAAAPHVAAADAGVGRPRGSFGPTRGFLSGRGW